MGFMKNLLEESGFNQKLAKKYLRDDKNRDNNLSCLYCNSANLSFKKIIGYGKKVGILYYYQAVCKNCKKRYFMMKTETVLEKLKNVPWRETKSYKQFKALKR